MGIREAWQALIGQPEQVKESRTGRAISMQNMQPAVWTPRQYDKFAEEGYQKNVIVYRCIKLIASNAAQVPWIAFRGDQELRDHPALALLDRPNPMQTGAEFLEAAISYELIAGNSYMEQVGPQGAPPRELYALRPDRMKIVPGEAGMPRGYIYKVGQNEVTFDVDPITGRSEILHIRCFNPLNDWYGMAPIEAAAMAADSHNDATKWNKQVLQNGCKPSGALQTGEDMTDEQFNRLKSQIDEQYAGPVNAGRPMLLEGGLEWVQMMLTQSDVDWLNGKELSAREIALAYNVPEQLVGVPGQQTYNNYREARLALYEDAILPLLDKYADALTNWFRDLFNDPTLRITYDKDEIDALAPRRESVWDKVQNSQFLTINEKREAAGYEPIEGGDVLFVPSTELPLNMAADPNLGQGGEDEQDAIKAAARLAYGEASDLDTELKQAAIKALQHGSE